MDRSPVRGPSSIRQVRDDLAGGVASLDVSSPGLRTVGLLGRDQTAGTRAAATPGSLGQAFGASPCPCTLSHTCKQVCGTKTSHLHGMGREEGLNSAHLAQEFHRGKDRRGGGGECREENGEGSKYRAFSIARSEEENKNKNRTRQTNKQQTSIIPWPSQAMTGLEAGRTWCLLATDSHIMAQTLVPRRCHPKEKPGGVITQSLHVPRSVTGTGD